MVKDPDMTMDEILKKLKEVEKDVAVAKSQTVINASHEEWSRLQRYLADARCLLRILSVKSDPPENK